MMSVLMVFSEVSMEEQAMAPPRPTPRRRFHFWVPTVYFAEGFPYSLVRQVATVVYKDFGASLQAVGMTSLFGLPWVLKFLWGPLIDEFATKRRWLIVMEGLLTCAMLLMALAAGMPGGLTWLTILFLMMAFLSATHDIAVDGYYLESLDKSQQAAYVGFQSMSFRVALVTGGGGILWVSSQLNWSLAFVVSAVLMAGILFFHMAYLPNVETQKRPMAELGRSMLRARVYLTLALLTGVIVFGYRLYVWKDAPLWWRSVRVGVADQIMGVARNLPTAIAIFLLLAMIGLALMIRPIKRWLYGSNSFYALAFVDYLDQPQIGLILFFIVTYRTGESFLLNMAYPFLSDIGLTRAQYSVAYGTFGIAASIVGGLLGGLLISRYGLKRMIWPLALSQNVLHFLYMFLAIHYRHLSEMRGELVMKMASGIMATPSLTGQLYTYAAGGHSLTPSVSMLTLAVVTEALGAGMGTAAFMVFIQRTCKARFKAANMATASGLMSVSAAMAGVFSGFIATWVGFTWYFALTFLITIPNMVAIFFLPHLDDVSKAAIPTSDGQETLKTTVDRKR